MFIYHVSCFLFSEGFRAACRLPPAWHEGTSINYVHMQGTRPRV